MAVAFRSSSDNGNATSDSNFHKAPVPTGAAAGDIVVAVLGQWDGSGTEPSSQNAPSGFTRKGGYAHAGDTLGILSVWWKRLTGSDTGTYDFLTPGVYTTIQCFAFTGCVASGDPFGAIATPVAGTFGSITSMSLTATDGAGALVFGVYNDSNGAHTPPTGFTEASDVDCATTAWKLAGGTTGSVTVSGASITSSSSAAAWVGELISTAGGSSTAEGGVGALGLTSTSTPRKVAVEGGRATLGLTSSSTPRKVAVERGTGAAGLTSSSTPRKVAVEVGRGTVGLTSSATARKVAPTGGVGALGLTSTGLQSSALARAVTGLGTLGLTTVATARKVAVERAAAALGLTSSSTPQKRAVEVGVTAVGLTSSSAPRKVAVERGTSTVGLTSRSTPGRRAAAAGRALLGLTSSSTRIPPAVRGSMRAAARVYGDMRAAARAAAATMRKG